MTVKEASNRWKLSEKTVRAYCKEGIIPEAYKGKWNQWYIPDMEKPPAGRYRLVIYLRKIPCIHEGAKPRFSAGMDELIQIYTYLSDNAFITEFTYQNDLIESLKNVQLTSEGTRLIDMEAKKNKDPKREITLSAGINGVVPHAGATYTRELR